MCEVSFCLFFLSVSGQLNATDIMLWTGLNRLGEDTGWQWSDGAPLMFVNWRASMRYFSWICYGSVITCSL